MSHKLVNEQQVNVRVSRLLEQLAGVLRVPNPQKSS
jgi:hypothetical protein